MEVEIRQVPALRVVGVRHIGPYWEIGEAYERLGAWLTAAGVPWGAVVGVFHDNPSEVPVDQLRSDACTTIGPEVVTDDPAVSVFEIAGGEHAWGRHLGPYSGLPAAWGEFLAGIPGTGRAIREGSSFEIYVNDCSAVPPEEVITDLYQPVQPV